MIKFCNLMADFGDSISSHERPMLRAGFESLKQGIRTKFITIPDFGARETITGTLREPIGNLMPLGRRKGH